MLHEIDNLKKYTHRSNKHKQVGAMAAAVRSLSTRI
jgi:hypothetical protein